MSISRSDRHDLLEAEFDKHSIARERQVLIENERSAEAKERAIDLFNCKDKAKQFQEDMNASGLLLDELTAKFCLFVMYGLSNIDVRSWAQMRNLNVKGTTAVAYGADDSTTLLMSNVLQFLAPQRIEELSRCTPDFFIHGGGSDGMDLAHKTIFWRELTPPRQGRSPKLDFILDTTTHGFWRTGTIKYANNTRESHMVTIEGPLNHLFTTTAAPQKFGKEFLHKSFWLNLADLNEEQSGGEGALLRRSKPENWRTCGLIRASWQLLSSTAEFRRLSPAEPDAFVDVEMPYLAELNIDSPHAEDLLQLLIASHALLNQANRKQYRDEHGRRVLVSEIQDYNAVLPVFLQSAKSEDSASTASQEAFKSLYPTLMKKGLTVQELEVELGVSTRSVRYYLNEWKQLNLVSDRKVKGRSVVEPGPAFNRLCRESNPDRQKRDFEMSLNHHLRGCAPLAPLPQHATEDCKCNLHSHKALLTNTFRGALCS